MGTKEGFSPGYSNFRVHAFNHCTTNKLDKIQLVIERCSKRLKKKETLINKTKLKINFTE